MMHLSHVDIEVSHKKGKLRLLPDSLLWVVWVGWELLPQCHSDFPSQSRSRSSHPTHTAHSYSGIRTLCPRGHQLLMKGSHSTVWPVK